MSAPANPAATRAYIIERLVGETGEPDHLIEAARSMATRAVPSLIQALNADLCFPLDIEVADVTIGRLLDAKPAEGSFDAMTVAPSIASPDALILTLEADALALAICAMFGGDAETMPAAIVNDPGPTDLEIASTISHCFATVLNGYGPRGLGIKFPLAQATAGLDTQKQVVRDAPAVRIAFRIFSAVASGRLVLTMPQRLLMKPRGEGGAANERDLARENAWGVRFGEEVMRSAVTLEATIPMQRMTLGELASLRIGEVIEMPKASPGETKLSARGKTLFVCEFGKLGQRYTVRVKQPFDADQDFIDGLVSA